MRTDSGTGFSLIKKMAPHDLMRVLTTKPCQLTTRSSFVTNDSSRRFQFPMLTTWVTTVSSSGSDDSVVIKISHGIVVGNDD